MTAPRVRQAPFGPERQSKEENAIADARAAMPDIQREVAEFEEADSRE